MESTGTSQLLQTALRIIDGYNQWDIEAILAPRAVECTQQVLPYRLNRPVLDNTEYREYFSKIMPYFKSFRVEILDVVVDLRHSKVAINARSKGDSVLGPYGNEYMLIFHMTDDHLKVLSIKEFVDSGYSNEYFQNLKEYIDKVESERSMHLD